MTAGTDLRLCRYFGLSNGFWLGAQAAFDTEVAEGALAAEPALVKPWCGPRTESRRWPANGIRHPVGCRHHATEIRQTDECPYVPKSSRQLRVKAS